MKWTVLMFVINNTHLLIEPQIWHFIFQSRYYIKKSRYINWFNRPDLKFSFQAKNRDQEQGRNLLNSTVNQPLEQGHRQTNVTTGYFDANEKDYDYINLVVSNMGQEPASYLTVSAKGTVYILEDSKLLAPFVYLLCWSSLN